MNQKITYIFPSRSRPTAFFETLNNIIEKSMELHFQIICTLDEDDPTMNNDEVKRNLIMYGNHVSAYWGLSKNKVDAINLHCDKVPEDTSILILISDDQKFIVNGFDEIIRIDMMKNFPDLDGVLHYDDGTPARDKLITMSIMGYNYFKRFGYLYNPEYANVFCDNEFTLVAKKLGKYKYIKNQQLYQHYHPAWGTARLDELYKRNEEPVSYKKDEEIYFRNLNNNFNL